MEGTRTSEGERERTVERNHRRNQQPDSVWDFVHQGGLSGLSRIPSRCSIWSIPTKTPGDVSQFSGRFFSFLSIFFQVLSTIPCFIAFLPYFRLVEDLSSINRVFIAASQRLCISASLGHSFSGFPL